MAADGRLGKLCAHERLAAEIRRRIADGTYPPNSYLPSERRFAEEHGAGRPTVAAAINLLVAEGIVSNAPGRGARVLSLQDRPSRPEIAVVYSLSFRPPFPPERNLRVEGVQDVFSRHQYRFSAVPVIPELDPDPVRVERSVAQRDIPALASRFGAFLFTEATGTIPIPQILQLEAQKFPLVVANLEEPSVAVSATWVDHRKTTLEAVGIMAGMGHHRIGFVGSDPSTYFYSEALGGFRAGMEKANLPVNEEWFVFSANSEPLTAYLLVRDLLKRPEPPTALVCGRDGHAMGVCQAAAELGLVIGRDISVIGFGGFSGRADVPALTTFREPAYEMGAVAAEMLIDRITHGWRPPEQRELEARLVLGRSAGPLIEPTDAVLPISAPAARES